MGTFVGVAMQDIKFDNVGKSSSGRLAVNMKAGEATIYSDRPHIHAGETVTATFPDPEQMTKIQIDELVRTLMSILTTQFSDQRELMFLIDPDTGLNRQDEFRMNLKQVLE